LETRCKHLQIQCGFRTGRYSLLRIQAAKDRLCGFPTLFLIQYSISIHDRWCNFGGRCIGGVQKRAVILGFPISISNSFLKLKLICCARKQVRPWSYLTIRLCHDLDLSSHFKKFWTTFGL